MTCLGPTSLTIGPAGKNERPNSGEDEMQHARLKDPEQEWGPSRIDFTMRKRRMIAQLKRERRAQYLLRAVSIPQSHESERATVEPFETASGILAYRKAVPNRLSLTSAAVDEETRHKSVTLPYVSILSSEVR